MCIIIDANVAAFVFGNPADKDNRPIFKWIEERDGILVYGGKNAKELRRVAKAALRIQEWKRQGRAFECSDVDVATQTNNLIASRQCRSDDHHVIALAIVSRARVLCSKDQTLHDDFTRLLHDPRGTIYQNASHYALLKHSKGCEGSKRKN